MKSSKSNSKSRAALKVAVPFDFSYSHGYFLKPDVLKSLTSRGAEPIPLFYDHEKKSLRELLKSVDAVMIPGGFGDVDPKLYGQKKKFENVKVIRERCDFECRLLEAYLPMEKPLLAICWGLQMVNVFLGGSLIQDIESQHSTSIRHQQMEPRHLPSHEVILHKAATKIFGSKKLSVNSSHHQAIDKLAPSLALEGQSPDEIIECFRMKDHPFAWGVQWHPERLKNDVVIPAFLASVRR